VWLQTTGDASDNEIAMDDLGYAYENSTGNSNQLRNVKDFVTVGMSQGFYDGNIAPGVDDYEYDENGNMTVDRNKGITSITYNYLNLPQTITFNHSDKIDYLYNAAGQKVQKTVTQYLTNSMEVKEVDYLDGYQTEERVSRIPVGAIATQLSNNEQYAGGVLQFFPHGEGYISATPNSIDINGVSSYFYNYVFNYTDHLGNVRISYTRDPGSNQLKILEENHYYPFGLKHSIYSTGHKRDYVSREDENSGASLPPVVDYVTSTRYQYKYNGKEFQDELGLGRYDYGWRNYDPALGRWMNVDPLAERYLSASPYTYVSNTPINALDPDGRYIIYRNDEMTLAYSNGNFYHATITQDKQGNYKTNLGEKYDAEKEKNLTVNALLATFNTIESSDDKDLKGQLSTLESSSNLHIYKDAKAGDGSNVTSEVIIQKGGNSLNIGKGKNESRHTITQLDFSFSSIMNYARIEGIAPCLSCTITHEMRHQYDYEIGNMSDDTGVSNNRNPVEIRAVNNENRIRKILGLPKRTSYGGKKIDSIKLK